MVRAMCGVQLRQKKIYGFVVHAVLDVHKGN